jgi:hypothetical protein
VCSSDLTTSNYNQKGFIFGRITKLTYFWNVIGFEAVKIHIAAKLSRQHGGKIYLSEIPSEEGFDGAAFAAEYAAAKRRGER